MSEPIRILVADDHTLFRDGLRAMFDSLPQTELVGEAATGAEAIIRAREAGMGRPRPPGARPPVS